MKLPLKLKASYARCMEIKASGSKRHNPGVGWRPQKYSDSSSEGWSERICCGLLGGNVPESQPAERWGGVGEGGISGGGLTIDVSASSLSTLQGGGMFLLSIALIIVGNLVTRAGNMCAIHGYCKGLSSRRAETERHTLTPCRVKSAEKMTPSFSWEPGGHVAIKGASESHNAWSISPCGR